VPFGNLFTVLPALIQAAGPQTVWDMILRGGISTKIILGILLAFSFMSWIVIFWKARQFSALRKQGTKFMDQIEKAKRLEEAYQAILAFPDSPYRRVFHRGMNFFAELRPDPFRNDVQNPRPGLSLTQLEALRLVMEKEEAEERDEMSGGLIWLAVIGTVSPLLGLMGTVLGVMVAFIGITASGSANIAAVAPGVAQALITTVAGLGVAIPAVIFYNYFVNRLNLVYSQLEGFSSEFIGTLAREGRI